MILSFFAALYLALFGNPPAFRFPCGTGIGHPCLQGLPGSHGQG